MEMTDHEWNVARMESAAADMAAVLDRELELGDFGFAVFDPRSKTPEERAVELGRQREAICEPDALAQFTAARFWLGHFAKIKAPNPRGTSYGLKHIAERDIGYTTNGVFIAAALAEGFSVRRVGDSPNALFNISTKAWAPPARYDGGKERVDAGA
jgi:hypothetical protein